MSGEDNAELEIAAAREKATFFSDVKSILATARHQTYKTINSIMVETYWKIGKRIVEEEQRGVSKAKYGQFLIKELSKQLADEFGKGFSVANLKNFRQFYLVFPMLDKSYTLCSQLSWSHFRLIMRVEDLQVREYYMKEVVSQSWSVRQLERNINTLYYERLLTNRNEDNILPEQTGIEKKSTRDFIKDPYVLEFLQLPEDYSVSEKEIEAAIINKLQQFLLELGKGFSFVGRQFRISTETTHYYIDLVFYNFLLKCFVLIDLKIDKLSHQDIGQMDMYVRMFDDLKKGEDDNPTVGIIFCTSKDETTVKYSVLNDNNHIFASKYRLILPTEDELRAELDRERQIVMGLLEQGDEENGK